uniref:Aper1_4 protein n=1 Tax=Fopius arisanus TaxID=64838 RepID=A0A0C9RFF4_9HYME
MRILIRWMAIIVLMTAVSADSIPFRSNQLPDDVSKCIGICPKKYPPHLILTLEHQECGKYCKCNEGIPYVYWCPEDFHFNRMYGTCTWPEDAKCPRWRRDHDERGCVGRCPEGDPIYAVHLPHQYCSKFCKCNHGVPHVLPCPPGHHFNPKEEVCDRYWHANCQGIRD